VKVDFKIKGSITLVFWMCSLGVHFTVKGVSNFNVIFSVENSKISSKTHSIVKRKSKMPIQTASVIDPPCLRSVN
jgi:hypothetical protein